MQIKEMKQRLMGELFKIYFGNRKVEDKFVTDLGKIWKKLFSGYKYSRSSHEGLK